MGRMIPHHERRLAIIAEARSWLGTRFHHQAAIKGVGVDCAGLVRGVGKETGLLDISAARWAVYANYGRAPHPERMRAALNEFMHPIAPEQARIGDVCWLAWREDLPMHLAILSAHPIGGATARPTIIHALADNDKVIEHGFSKEWRDRVDSWWRFPGLDRCGGRG